MQVAGYWMSIDRVIPINFILLLIDAGECPVVTATATQQKPLGAANRADTENS